MTTAPDPTPPADRDHCIDGWEVTPAEVHRMMADGAELLLLDCREPEEEPLASINGGRLIPMGDISRNLPELEEHAEEPIVVYCHTGRRSLEVTAYLRKMGFEDVKSMAGGIQRWHDEVDSSVGTY